MLLHVNIYPILFIGGVDKNMSNFLLLFETHMKLESIDPSSIQPY
jgi:hypothetical protein